ncbi:kinetochore-associated Ndc80 complex subunit ndc80 [Myotisia sp. PD_48]|nr:kinetochore-associated Ndc80 complex subunit ndc80 [Myotisia sp. PD_48]
MAQDTNLFSARRPRETLGSLQNSAIPQPSSVLKRTSLAAGLQQPPFTSQHARSTSFVSSQSRPQQPVFQRPSSGNYGIDGGLSSVRRSTAHNIFHSASAKRQSYAPMSMAPPPPPQLRRSSILSRPSTGHLMAHQSFFAQSSVPAGVPRDPRPLRDRSFQARISQEILEYLSLNNFELEMKHSLTQNTLKSPTQKDFNYIFQWLYKRIDPGYQFQKSIDSEVPPILKQLRYPFEKNITKSQIAAVGGTNWYTFLGMLHWMMQYAQMLDRFYMDQYDHACAEAGVDVTGDRIMFRFLSGAYHDWLQGSNDEDEDDDEMAEKRLIPHIKAMAAEFEKGNEKHEQDLEALREENRSLLDQIEEIKKNAPDMARLEKHFKILEDDKKKFEDYNENVQGKITKYENRIAFLDEELKKVEFELQNVEEERANLQASVDEQGITIQDIDRMSTERDRLQKNVDDTLLKLDEAHARVMEQESDANSKLEELEQAAKLYNSLVYQAGLVPATTVNAKGNEYELHLNINENKFSSSQLGTSQNRPSLDGDRLLADGGTGYHPSNLINLDLRGIVRSNFVALRKEINDRRKNTLNEDLNQRDLLDNIKEAMEEKQNEVEALEHKRRAAEEEFEKTKEITTTQKLASDAQIEKMEKELAKMRASLAESVQLMEQREMNTNIEHEQLILKANTLREELHTSVESILNDVIRFKVHVQKSLEDYENFIMEEVEQELGADADDNAEDSPQR